MHGWFVSRLFPLLLALAVAVLPATALPSQRIANSGYPIGSIVIKTDERNLYYLVGESEVIVYPIAVGRAGRQWTGVTTVSRKVLNPTWAPPPIIRRENPKLPALIPPGPGNPLGVAVLVLGDGTYGIHGTNRDETIGTNASYGCFRMHNTDVLALFKNVVIGTKVFVQR